MERGTGRGRVIRDVYAEEAAIGAVDGLPGVDAVAAYGMVFERPRIPGFGGLCMSGSVVTIFSFADKQDGKLASSRGYVKERKEM